MDSLFALLLLLLAGWFWLDALRAREMAVGLARRACDAHGLQLLDQAVALRRLGLRWTAAGLRLRRSYRFEFSDGGLDRQVGELILIGLALELLRLTLPPERTTGPAAIGDPDPHSDPNADRPTHWPDATGLVRLTGPPGGLAEGSAVGTGDGGGDNEGRQGPR